MSTTMIQSIRKLIEEASHMLEETDAERYEKHLASERKKNHLASAHRKLWGPSQDWIHSPSRKTKEALLNAWKELPDHEKQAHADNVKETFAKEHGGEHVTVYRYKTDKMDGEHIPDGMSVSTKKPDGVKHNVYRIHHSDVLAHYGQSSLPFGNKSFGHEKEIVLKPGAKPEKIGHHPG